MKIKQNLTERLRDGSFLILTAAALVFATAYGFGRSRPEAPSTVEPTVAEMPAETPLDPVETTVQAPRPVAEPAPEPAPPVRPAPRHYPRPAEPVEVMEPTPTPEPEPLPEPEPRIVRLSSGVALSVELVDAVSSEYSQVGDVVRGRVAEDVFVDDVVAIPVGSIVEGSVSAVVPRKRVGGQPMLAVDFSRLELTSGRDASIQALYTAEGKRQTKKDAGTIAGATAGGAILGRVLKDNDRDKGTLVGAIIGAAAGTAIASRRGDPVELAAGTEIVLELRTPVEILLMPGQIEAPGWREQG